MLRTKVEKALRQLRFAARFLWNFQATQGRELHVEIAYFPRTFANASQHLHELFLVAILRGTDLFDQSLQASCCGAKAVDALRFLSRRQAHQFALRLLKDKFAALGRHHHRNRILG